jgi:hypothetical protein
VKKDEMVVSAETLERLASERDKDNGASGMGNLLSAIGNNVAGAISEKEAEVAALVTRVRALNYELAILKTHQQIGGDNA